jgi:hypothetical protein
LPKRSLWGQPFPLKRSLPELSSQPLVLKWRVNEGSGVRTRLVTSSSTDSSQNQPPPGQQSLDRSPSSPSSAPLFLKWSVHGDEAARKRRKLGPWPETLVISKTSFAVLPVFYVHAAVSHRIESPLTAVPTFESRIIFWRKVKSSPVTRELKA